MSVTLEQSAPVDSKARAAWMYRVLGVAVTPTQGKGSDGLRERLEKDLKRLELLNDRVVEKGVDAVIAKIRREIEAGDQGAALALLSRLEEVVDAAERKKNAKPTPPEKPKDPTRELLSEITDFKDILDKTDKQVKANAKQFDQFQHLDDIVLSGGIKTDEKTRLLKLIDSTIQIVERRAETFITPARQLGEQIAKNNDPEVQKHAELQPDTLKTVNFWVSLIPDGVYSEASLIKDRVAALTVKPGSDEQKKLISGAGQKIAGLKGQVDDFKTSIESHSSRSFARTDPFGTKMLTSLDSDEEKKFRALTEELARAGQVFLDATISIDKLNEQGIQGDQRETRYDFQTLYDKIVAIGLPEAWWPPRLVERVQAWRKASRIHGEQNAKRKSVAKEIGEEALGAFGQLMKAGSFAGSIAAFDNSFTPEAKGEPPKPDESASRMAMIFGSVCELTNGLKEDVKGALKGEAIEALKKLDPTEAIDLNERLESIIAIVKVPTEFCASALDLVTNIGKHAGTPWAKTFDTKVVPGLSLAMHILKLIDAIRETAQSALLTAKTQRLGVTSDQQNATGLRQDGGTTTGALKKAEQSQKEYTARKGLEVFTESVNVTAQAVILSGVSAPAGYGLSAVASGIELAGEMVFDGIDWSQAKVAKKLLDDARAGSVIAQQLLFEKCELYAKLYLAILVREGDPLGKKYIADRGITQDSLDKPTAVWLLGEALRDAVQKEDDTEIDDSLVKHLAGPIGKLAARLVDGVGDGVGYVVEKGRQALSAEYDANWKVTPAPVLDPSVWTQIKENAVDEAGLRNDTSGITAALTALEKTKAAYAALANPPSPPKKGAKPPTDKEKLGAISEILQQIGVVSGTMSGWRPVQGKKPREEHAPMRAVLNEMQKLLNALGNTYKTEAGKLPGVTLSTDQNGNKVLDIQAVRWAGLDAGGQCKTQWDTTWNNAIETIGLAEADYGVSKLLGTVQTQWDALQDIEGGSQIVDAKFGEKLYKARKGALDALMAARDAIAPAMKAVQLFPNLCAFVTAAHSDMAARARALDNRMCEATKDLQLPTKPKLPAHHPKSDASAFAQWAAVWLQSWTEAAHLGFVSPKGGDGLSASLNGFGTTYAAYLTAKPTDKSRPAKRDIALGDGAKVLKVCDALIQAEPYAPDLILARVREYAADATAARRALIDEVANTEVMDKQTLEGLKEPLPDAIDPSGKGLMKTRDFKSAWEGAYKNCVDKGVAAKAQEGVIIKDDVGKELAGKLDKIKTAMDAANKLLASGKCKAEDLTDLYKTMDKVREEISGAIKQVNKLLAAPGIAANEQVLDLISAMGAEFTNYLEVIEDRKGKIEVSDGKLDADAFSTVKAMFGKQGLAPKDDTGISKLLKDLKSLKGSKRDKPLAELKTKIDDAIKAAEKAVADSKNPPQPQQGKKKAPPPVQPNYTPWINYLTELKAAAK